MFLCYFGKLPLSLKLKSLYMYSYVVAVIDARFGVCGIIILTRFVLLHEKL